MSATLGNVGDLQKFLKAEHYTNDFRPVSVVPWLVLAWVLLYVLLLCACSELFWAFMNHSSFQVQLNEYVKLEDSIYEVDLKEEQCLKFSRLLNYKVCFSISGLYWPSC